MYSTVDDVKGGIEKSPSACSQGDIEMEALEVEEQPILRRIDML
jgi:hypothetical protein